MCSQVGLGQSYGDGGIGWEVELWVSFSPVPGPVQYLVSCGGGVLLDNCDVDWSSRACLVDFCHFLSSITIRDAFRICATVIELQTSVKSGLSSFYLEVCLVQRKWKRSTSTNRRFDFPRHSGTTKFMHEASSNLSTRSRPTTKWRKTRKLQQKLAQLIQLRVQHGSKRIPQEQRPFQVRRKMRDLLAKEIAAIPAQSTRHLLLQRDFSRDLPPPRFHPMPPNHWALTAKYLRFPVPHPLIETKVPNLRIARKKVASVRVEIGYILLRRCSLRL
jgi:hypothetical protein